MLVIYFIFKVFCTWFLYLEHEVIYIRMDLPSIGGSTELYAQLKL